MGIIHLSVVLRLSHPHSLCPEKAESVDVHRAFTDALV